MIQKDEELQRQIGVLGLSANIVNIIIGSGIFILPAIVAGSMGASGVFAYVFCGILITLIMLCFAEVGSKITTTGGLYTYIETTFGPFAGFLSGNLFLVAVLSADAAVSNALVNVMSAAFPVLENAIVRGLFLFVIFFGLSLINILGVKQGVNLIKILVVAKMLPLLLLIVLGLPKISLTNISIDSFPSFEQLGATSLILFFAFIGGETGLNVSGEVKNPNKNIPKSIFIGITAVLIIYILIQLVTQGVLCDALAHQKAPLAETARTIFGDTGFLILTTGAAVSMFGYLSGAILNMPRILYALSRDSVIPVKAFSRIHSKFKTPHLAILAYAMAGFIMATLGSFEKLAVIATGAILFQYLGVSLAVIKLRVTQKTKPGEFKIPGGFIVPILSSLIIIYFLSKMTLTEAIGTLIFTGFLTIVYLVKTKVTKN